MISHLLIFCRRYKNEISKKLDTEERTANELRNNKVFTNTIIINVILLLPERQENGILRWYEKGNSDNFHIQNAKFDNNLVWIVIATFMM